MHRFPKVVLLLLLGGCALHHYAEKGKDGVSLYLRIPNAKEVLFAGSLDNFQQHRAHRIPNGYWQVSHLPNREFRYFYLVDGTVLIPDCRYREQDDFGTVNCIYQP